MFTSPVLRSLRCGLLRLAAAVALALFATAPTPAEAADYPRAGAFLGLGFHTSLHQFDEATIEPFDPARLGLDDQGFGGSFWGGWRWLGPRALPDLASEVQLDVAHASGSGLGGGAELVTVSLTPNLKIYPLEGRFQPYALVGGGLGIEDLRVVGDDAQAIQRGAFVARFGGGIDVYVTEHLALAPRVTYTLATGRLDESETVNIVVGLHLQQ